MNRGVTALLLALGSVILVASGAALKTGVDETRLSLSGPRRELLAEEARTQTGWLAVAGCVRHDLAVAVTATGKLYRLGEQAPESEEGDRVFTPLAGRDDCDDSRPPRRLLLLVEGDDALSNTLGHVYDARVPPPPVPAIVEGVVGFATGHLRLAAQARVALGATRPDAGELPLLVKAKRPAVVWVGVVTAGAGLHGLLLVGAGIWWALRRHRRRRALLGGEISEEEEDFFRSETLE